MSRFKPQPSLGHAVVPFRPSEPAVTEVLPAVPVDLPAHPIDRTESASPGGGVVETLGYILYCIYAISGPLNEWTIRILGTKAYISSILVLLLPLVLLISNNRLRGLKHVSGRWWLAFLLLMVLDTPFSCWRGSTVTLLVDYTSRSLILYFFITAFATTLRRVRGLMYVNIACSAILLYNCRSLGTVLEDGRFQLSGSLFFANSNDLGLQLLMGLVLFVYLLMQKGVFSKALAVPGIILSCMYMLKTGSRGSMIAAACCCVFVFFSSRNKILVGALAALVAIIGIVSLPASTLRRLTFLTVDESEVQTMADAGAVTSQLQRRELFRRSLVETVKHPLFGVGPGQFSVFVVGKKAESGEWVSYVGTHNSYTQVSSECGIPAFVCYCTVLVFCFRLNYRIFREARDNPAHRVEAGLSFTLLMTALVYSVSTFFFHIAYTAALPALSGMTVALYLVTKPTTDPAVKLA